MEVPEHVGALQQLPGGRVGAPGRGVGQRHRHQCGRDGRVRLGARVIRAQVDGGHGGSDGRVHLGRGAVRDQRGRDRRISLRCRLVGRKGCGDARLRVKLSFCRLTLSGA